MARAGWGRMAAWRAHAYGPARELRLEEARVPPLRAPDDVLVRVSASSINPLDVAMIGGYGSRVLNALRSLEGGAGPEFPLVPGRDFAGRVALAGARSRLRRGQRVWGVQPPHRAGAHAQYVLVKDRWVGEAPAALDDLQAGGALYAGLTACSLLRAAGVRPGGGPGGGPGAGCGGRGGRVLLLGLGGVGGAALQLLRHGGTQVVVGCAGDASARALRLGATAALDRHAPDYDRQLEEAGPYDAILDCAGLGGSEAARRRWRYARYVTLSTPLLRATDERGLLAGALGAAAALAAQCVSAARAAPAPLCPPHVRWAYFVPSAADIEMLRRLADGGKLTVDVERAWAWWRADEAYERAAQGSARGKLLLDFTAQPPDDIHTTSV